MRFVIAGILIALYIFVILATSKGIEGIDTLVSYLFGTILAPAIIAALFCIPKSGRNNKRFFRVFNLFLLLAILGQFGKLADVIEASTSPPQTVPGANNKVQIVVPGSWSIKAPPNENIVLNLSNSSGYLNIIVGYEPAGDDRLQLEHYAQLIGNKFKKNAPNFKSLSDIQKCDSTKLECVFQVANTTNGEKGTITILASLSAEDGYYNFMAITNPGLFDTYKEDILNALMSFDEIQK
jgi:hypothetical protein